MFDTTKQLLDLYDKCDKNDRRVIRTLINAIEFGLPPVMEKSRYNEREGGMGM